MKKLLDEYRMGGIGALIDEYERAISELKAIVKSIAEENYVRIADTETENEECRSIQTMMSHVINAGYGYSNNIRKVILMSGEPHEFKLINYQNFDREIDRMFAYQIETLDGKWNLSYKEIDNVVHQSRHGYTENLEQILEHAIVHILRHRRQTEKFLLKFAKS